MKPTLIVQNCQVESPGTIVDWLKAMQRPFDIVHSYEGQQLPNVDDIGAVISLGSPIPVNEYARHEFLQRVFDFTTDAVRASVPYLGICLGGQMLARVLGTEVKRNKTKEIGVCTVKLTQEGATDSLFSGFEKEFRVFQWHADTFDLPAGATLLATSDVCRNQAFRLGNAVAIQFHLEAVPSEIPIWCEAYHDELSGEGLSQSVVVADYNEAFGAVKKMAFRFLDSFFEL